jgi:hypothetical protein
VGREGSEDERGLGELTWLKQQEILKVSKEFLWKTLKGIEGKGQETFRDQENFL